jgi:AcrR family transcriptional regulator
VGARLGSAPTAVYWYVKNKDDLLVLAGDQVWDEIRRPDPGAGGWREAAAAMAADLYAMFNRHPWLVQALGSHLFYGPGKARHDDHSLAVYEAAGFAGARADQATAAVFTFVLGSALGEAANASLARRLGRGGGDPEALMRDTMAKAAEVAMQFPRLRARVEAGVATEYNEAPGNTFEFGLQALLDGLETQLSVSR